MHKCVMAFTNLLLAIFSASEFYVYIHDVFDTKLVASFPRNVLPMQFSSMIALI